MPGHMGAERVTVQSLRVIQVDAVNNLVLLKGAVPGHKNSFLVVKEARKRPKGWIKPKTVQIISKKSAKAHTAGKK